MARLEFSLLTAFTLNWLSLLLALLPLAAGQSNICTQATVTINSQADATALASCSNIDGSVLVGSTAVGNIAINGPSAIAGDLSVLNATGVTQLSSSTIHTIGGTFKLQSNAVLASMAFGLLQNVHVINWSNLPKLEAAPFAGPTLTVQMIFIANTNIATLPLFNDTTLMSTIDINNNPKLTDIFLNFETISTDVVLDSNGPSAVCQFPQLTWAANMTLKDCSQLDIPLLTVVNGSLGLYNNSFTTFSAPVLTSVGNSATGAGTFAFDGNTVLTNLSAPQLKSVGGALQIDGNSDLDTISLPALAAVGGAINLIGSFSTPSFPSLANVRGGFSIESTGDVDCSEFQKEASSGIIQGAFVCKSNVLEGATSTNPPTSSSSTRGGSGSTGPSTPNNNSPSGSGSSGSSGLSTGAKGGIGIAISLVVIIVVLAVFAWRRGYKLSLSLQRNTKPKLPNSQPADPAHPTESELPLGGHHEKTELQAGLERPIELSGDSLTSPVPQAHELYSLERYEVDS